MKGSVTVRGFAKVNLGLWVTGTDVDENGDVKHTLETIFHALPNFYDELEFDFKKGNGKVSIKSDCIKNSSFDSIKTEDNIITKAFRKFADKWQSIDMSVKVTKNIPVAAGLAGGSADAAATIVALEKCHIIGNYTNDDVASLGSDVPFALMAAKELDKIDKSKSEATLASITAYGTHFGEKLSPIPVQNSPKVTVFTQPYQIYTKESFREYDKLINHNLVRYSDYSDAKSHIEQICTILSSEDKGNTNFCMQNDLEVAATNLFPDLGETLQNLRQRLPEKSKTVISGSGPTIINICI